MRRMIERIITKMRRMIQRTLRLIFCVSGKDYKDEEDYTKNYYKDEEDDTKNTQTNTSRFRYRSQR